MKRSAFATSLFLLAACQGEPSPVAAPEAQVIVDAPPAAAPILAPKLSNRLSYPAPRRLVAIGDLHGDLNATQRALRLASAIDENLAWSGGDLVVVQTGDVLDRGDDDRAVLDFLEALRPQAKQAGGDLILLSGNHELMNAARDFRYVTPGGFSAFVDENGRGAAFQPGGPYAKKLAEHAIMARVGDTVFVHGGIHPKHVRYGLDRMNDEVRAWLLAERPEPPAVMQAEDAPLWSRAYSTTPDAAACAELSEALTALESKRMVVGHTVQQAGISAACDEKVFRIDVGMSKFYGGSVQVLEIQDGKVTILKE